MSILTHSPAIVRDGLVLCLDAGLNRSTNALADSGHPANYYAAPKVEEDYQPTGCKLISRADKTILQNTDFVKYGNNVIADWAGPATGSGVSVTYVDNTSGFFIYLNTGYGFTSNPVVGKRYRIVIRAKTNTGVTYFRFWDGVSAFTWISVDTNTTLETYTFDFTCQHATGCYVNGGGSYTTGEITYFDRFEVYELSPWLDVSGHNNHAEITNAPTFSAESGAGGTRSFDFDGTSDYMDLGNAFQSTFRSSFSIGMWVKPADGQPAGSQVLIGSENSSDQDTVYVLITTAGNTVIKYQSDNDEVAGISDAVVFANGQNDWHHIVCTATSGGNLVTYVNGIVVDTTDASGATFADWTSSDELFVGAHDVNGTPDNFFEGKIAIAHVYNRALTAAEIQQNYRTHKGRFGL